MYHSPVPSLTGHPKRPFRLSIILRDCVPIGAQIQPSLSAPYRAFTAGYSGEGQVGGTEGGGLREAGIANDCLASVNFESRNYALDPAGGFTNI